MCTCEDGLANIFGAPSIDEVMSYNSLTTNGIQQIDIYGPIIDIYGP